MRNKLADNLNLFTGSIFGSLTFCDELTIIWIILMAHEPDFNIREPVKHLQAYL